MISFWRKFRLIIGNGKCRLSPSCQSLVEPGPQHTQPAIITIMSTDTKTGSENIDHDQHPRHLLLHLLRIDLAHVAIPIGLPHLPGTEDLHH